MDFDKALEVAKSQKSHINCFTEYENAFVFAYDCGEPTKGGDSPIVVPKDGGRCLDFLYALQKTDLLDGELIREGRI